MPTSAKTFSTPVPNKDSILLRMPQDIRDETYRCLVKGSYILYRPPNRRFTAHFRAIPGALRGGENLKVDQDGPNFSILRVSKAINIEAMRVLYKESIFESRLDFGVYKPYMHHANEITDGMMKLKFKIFGVGEDTSLEAPSRAYLKNMEDICRGTIEHFTGTKITRNYMHITFYATRGLEYELTSPLFCSLENLSGFRTVRIDLLPTFFIEPQLEINFNLRVTQAVKARLEPTLGPTVIQHFQNPGDDDYYRYLIFHPHEYIVEKLGPEVKPERERHPPDDAEPSSISGRC